MEKRRALITDITGQDGSYLAELLVEKGYVVGGIVRNSSRDFPEYIERLRLGNQIQIFYSDIRDTKSIVDIVAMFKPHEIYNLASQSHVGLSFVSEEDTFAVNYVGATALIEGALAINPATKIYQASSSEMFGLAESPQTENTSFNPVSPYGQSKLITYQEAVCQPREKGLFVASGILYNHESPRRGKKFCNSKNHSHISKN